jgi:hypothetical protein
MMMVIKVAAWSWSARMLMHLLRRKQLRWHRLLLVWIPSSSLCFLHFAHMIPLHIVVSVEGRVLDVVESLNFTLFVRYFWTVLHLVTELAAAMANGRSLRIVFWI